MIFISQKEFSRRFRLKQQILEENEAPLTGHNSAELDKAFDKWGNFDRAKAQEIVNGLKDQEG